MDTFCVVDGVHGIDVELFGPGFTAVYLFDGEHPTLVDAGAASSEEAILAGLARCGVDPAELSNLILSHVHADHSGAASALVSAAPSLDVYIHELTAPHLVEPSSLVESSRRAMGDHFDAMGEQDPVPEENVIAVPSEGTTVAVGDDRLELVYAPGHSPDHFAVWSPGRRLLFAAECIGLHMPAADRWLPPATLPNFDVERTAETIEQLRDLDPATIVFPHFGVWPHEPAAAFETAASELERFDRRILALHEAAGSLEEARRAVAEELIDLAPPYGEHVQDFFATLVTDGFLTARGVLQRD